MRSASRSRSCGERVGGGHERCRGRGWRCGRRALPSSCCTSAGPRCAPTARTRAPACVRRCRASRVRALRCPTTAMPARARRRSARARSRSERCVGLAPSRSARSHAPRRRPGLLVAPSRPPERSGGRLGARAPRPAVSSSSPCGTARTRPRRPRRLVVRSARPSRRPRTSRPALRPRPTRVLGPAPALARRAGTAFDLPGAPGRRSACRDRPAAGAARAARTLPPGTPAALRRRLDPAVRFVLARPGPASRPDPADPPCADPPRPSPPTGAAAAGSCSTARFAGAAALARPRCRFVVVHRLPWPSDRQGALGERIDRRKTPPRRCNDVRGGGV